MGAEIDIINNNNNNNNNGIYSEGDGDAKNYLKQLITDGNTVPVDKDVDSYELQLPVWYNDKLFKRAQKFYKQNVWAMFLGKLTGLLAILSIPTILQILMFTKKSNSPKMAYRRYIATLFHMINWYLNDLKPGTKSWRSLAAVRKRHVIVSNHSKRNNVGLISQKDMAITQFGFMGFIVLRHEYLGVQVTDRNIEAFIHFWRVIGFMMGIQDRFNVCTDNVDETKKRLQIIMDEQLKPNLTESTANFNEMCDHVVTGLWSFNPFLDTKSFLFFTKRLANVTGYNYFKSETREEEVIDTSGETGRGTSTSSTSGNPLIIALGWSSRFYLYLTIIIHQFLLRVFLFRWYFNGQILLSRFLITYFPFLAFIKFGIRDSYVRILKGDKE